MDEVKEGVWGYLVPLDRNQRTLILRRRVACMNEEEEKEREKEDDSQKIGPPSNGYLIGRHPECGKLKLLLSWCRSKANMPRLYH